jgi:hypothetical protein
MTRITVAKGDGIGPEIMEATLKILSAAGAQIEIDEIEIGEKVYLSGNTSGIAKESWDIIRRNKVFLKAPITTPQGGGYKSLNVTTRKFLGLYANIALMANVFLIMALLSTMQATLTLPGIAGIVLTMGMAVDANVLINERIREELRNGHTTFAAIQAGFDKAFWTIADSHVTQLLTALLLFAFGSGPIKGFAITLTIGVITSMFTALMVSRLLVHWTYSNKKVTRVSV